MLVVLRGSSGSGKSTVARLVQEELGSPTAVLQQDHFRRIIYREREQESLLHADLLEAAARHCLGRGHNVVMDGIFNAPRYAPLIQRVASLVDDARFYAFDLTFEETARRHRTRPEADEFTVDQMATWYRGWQPLPFVNEQRITRSETVSDIVERIIRNR